MCWTYVAHRRYLQGNLSYDLICEVKSFTESTDFVVGLRNPQVGGPLKETVSVL